MKWFFWGRKVPQHYRGLLMKADTGLHEQIAARLQAEIPAGSEILDLGAGEGALCERLVDLGYRVTAADKDAASFRCRRAAFSAIDFDAPTDIERFVAANAGRFDAVLGIEVIEHVQDPWQYARRLLSMAKPGGLVLVTTPNTASWLSRTRFFFTGRFHQFGDADLAYGHISPLSPWQLSLILRAAGGTGVEIVPAGTLPPVYLSGFAPGLLSLLLLPLRPFMRGLKDGWCIMATARRPA